jgi:poly-gamma-glutamate capsule biosynthesis protein CapA/YwtB (metallophosphatase superfamily)
MRIFFRSVFFLTLLPSLSVAQLADTARITLLFAGDIMGHDSQIQAAWSAKENKYDYASCFALLKSTIQQADLAIGNLELTFAGPPYKGYPAFSSPDALAITLKDVGFDALVTANNHSCDKGKKGITRTIDVLDSVGLNHTGTFKNKISRDTLYPLIIEKNNFKIALLNYTYGTNGIPVPKPTIVNQIDTTQIAEDIKKVYLDSVDVIVAFMHWGAEYQPLPDKNQIALTSLLQQKGVQLVIGAHPHVLQPVVRDTIKQTLVAYSLGNFVSGQRDRYKNGGMMLQIELEKIFKLNEKKPVSIKNAGYYLHYMHKNAERKYIAIPAFAEGNIMEYVENNTSKEAFKLFLDDSRALFEKQNVGVSEIKNQPH